MFEPYALIVSLVALGVSWRAYLLSKQAHKIQSEAHGLQKSEIEARQQPKVQVTNETFLSSWQFENSEPRCMPEEIKLRYSSVVTNKGEAVALLESVTIEVGAVDSPLSEPTHGLGCLVSGAMYLAAGESISLGTTIAADTISMIRHFFEKPEAVLVFTLVVRFRGYAGPIRTRRAEIYRLNHEGGIVSKGNYDAASGVPRTYLLTDA